MARFRFQDQKIWQVAIEIANELFDQADGVEQKKLYRFADQLICAMLLNEVFVFTLCAMLFLGGHHEIHSRPDGRTHC